MQEDFILPMFVFKKIFLNFRNILLKLNWNTLSYIVKEDIFLQSLQKQSVIKINKAMDLDYLQLKKLNLEFLLLNMQEKK